MGEIILKAGHVLRFGLYFLANAYGVDHPAHVMGMNEDMRNSEIDLYDRLAEAMKSGAEEPLVEIAAGKDDVCQLCPGKDLCDERGCEIHDKTIASILGVEVGRDYSPRQIADTLKLFHAKAQGVYDELQ